MAAKVLDVNLYFGQMFWGVFDRANPELQKDLIAARARVNQVVSGHSELIFRGILGLGAIACLFNRLQSPFSGLLYLSGGVAILTGFLGAGLAGLKTYAERLLAQVELEVGPIENGKNWVEAAQGFFDGRGVATPGEIEENGEKHTCLRVEINAGGARGNILIREKEGRLQLYIGQGLTLPLGGMNGPLGPIGKVQD